MNRCRQYKGLNLFLEIKQEEPSYLFFVTIYLGPVQMDFTEDTDDIETAYRLAKEMVDRMGR